MEVSALIPVDFVFFVVFFSYPVERGDDNHFELLW